MDFWDDAADGYDDFSLGCTGLKAKRTCRPHVYSSKHVRLCQQRRDAQMRKAKKTKRK